MTFTELKDILARVTVADGRVRSDELHLITWHEVIGHLPFELAVEATVKVLSDPTLIWYRPAQILHAAEQIMAEAESLQRSLTNRGIPIPHGAASMAGRAHMKQLIQQWNIEAHQTEIES